MLFYKHSQNNIHDSCLIPNSSNTNSVTACSNKQTNHTLNKFNKT